MAYLIFLLLISTVGICRTDKKPEGYIELYIVGPCLNIYKNTHLCIHTYRIYPMASK